MRTRSVAVLCFTLLSLSSASAAPLGAAFTYQGKLAESGLPANGSYDLKLTLFDAVGAGNAVSGPITNRAVTVSDGLFTTTLDFGGDVFTGEARWLEIGVRTNGSGVFSTLSPRQSLTPSPYALFAPRAGMAGTASGVVAGSIGNTALAPGAVDSSRIADGSMAVADLSPALLNSTFWRLGGNSGTRAGSDYLGTTDDQPLEFRVNNLRAMRLEPTAEGAPNVVFGASPNFVAPGVVGATISGGGWLNPGGTVVRNSIMGAWSVIGGGLGNQISSFAATIGGGNGNSIDTDSAHCLVGGGKLNTIATGSEYSAVVGGSENTIKNDSKWALLVGGYNNSIGIDSGQSVIGGGSANGISNYCRSATIAGGWHGSIGRYSSYGAIGGGQNNDIATNSWAATISGGKDNKIASNCGVATIAGGERNQIGTNAMHSTIGGGYLNQIGTNSRTATIAGGLGNGIAANSGATTIGGGTDNNIGEHATYSSIGGGYENRIATGSTNALIAGGYDNFIGTNSFFAAIGGGRLNAIESSCPGSIVAGGYDNRIGARSGFATVAGGWNNHIGENASSSTIAGGHENFIPNNVYYATIPGGNFNTAAGYFSLAAGNRAKANHTGAFVWADSSNFDFGSTVDNGFFARAVGGVKFVTGIDAAGVQAAGVRLVSGSSSWATLSDRAAKSNVEAVDTRDLLEKLAVIPVQTWNWNAQDPSIRHIGPMAQDFHAAFAVGEDNRHISTVDADGVALAAIQGLNQKVEARSQRSDVRIQRLEAESAALLTENAELKQRLVALERLVQSTIQTRKPK